MSRTNRVIAALILAIFGIGIGCGLAAINPIVGFFAGTGTIIAVGTVLIYKSNRIDKEDNHGTAGKTG